MIFFIKLILNPTYFFNYLRKLKLEKKFKDKFLTIGLNSNIINSKIGMYVFLGDNTKIVNSEIGKHTYFNSNSISNNAKIGSFCSIGSNVIIGMGNHPTNLISTHPAFYSNNKGFKTFSNKMYYNEIDDIEIGNDVWIGSDVKLIGNVKIGNGAIIATGSIVTKDIPPYAVYGGIPAKLIKYRFEEDILNELLHINWWEQSEEWFTLNYKDFLNVKEFINKYRKVY